MQCSKQPSLQKIKLFPRILRHSSKNKSYACVEYNTIPHLYLYSSEQITLKNKTAQKKYNNRINSIRKNNTY